MIPNFTGTGVAIVTPFLSSGKIDYNSLNKLLNCIVDNEIDFVVGLGTTSEAVTLTSDEKKEVMKYVIEVVNNRVPIVMGIGGNNTAAVVNEIKNTNFKGVAGILSVAPYYNKPNQRGLYEHFKAIANSSPVPIILYNVPSRTSSNIAAETVLKLAIEFTNIVAVKEASGDLAQVMEIIKNKPDGFSVLSGDDALTFPMISLGAEGVISVVANAFPSEFSTMVNQARNNDTEKAREIHYSLLEIIDLLFADGNPAGIKAALEIMGIMSNNLRLPMIPVTYDVYLKLSQEIENYNK
ncbi:MAG TPA: 4-hydroxy-tetrahydrodipicolinate synthase [Bacteroidales bacterium]|jgi:4-hydroxy-tetrahydrodipicolinate synthase|nr:4-hydroxy-tetrahydrodipicolinate synthase [Bacteroidota bacterium]HJN05883.1 4-hydroxy-tetrahydrodipicolinate synthase [Bacteroidales bacterium]|tara:strand:+ start:1246 stop:2130 length:885 start_codon:yes stop_codon:yes gene_type:complete